MVVQRLIKKATISRDWIITFTLIFFIIYGLAVKLYISVNLGLNSDSVGTGLMSMEIGKHHNYLLTGYHLLSTDNFVFTELIPFQLVPQILTDYDPLTLKIIIFIIFVLAILILAYLVYFVTRNILSALLFGALAANITPNGYLQFASPTAHTATVIFGAAILLILLYINKSTETTKEKASISQENTNVTLTIPLLYLILLIVLVFLSVFSDTIILIWVLIPFILAYLLFYKEKTNAMNLTIISVFLTSLIAYGIKTYFISDWIKADYGIKSILNIFFVNLPLLFKAQVMFLNRGLYRMIQGANNINIFDILSIFLFVLLILYAIKNLANDVKSCTPEKRFFYAVILISIAIIIVSFLISSYVYDIQAARYLIFGTLAILMLVAVSYSEPEKCFILIVLVMLVFSGISNYQYIKTMDPTPNDREYDLIRYLANNNLVYGYGTYWDSNSITYLSREKVTIRSTIFLPDEIRPDMLNSCERWWEYQPERAFLINDTERSDRSQYGLPTLIKQINPSSVFHYRNYDIYPINLRYTLS